MLRILLNFRLIFCVCTGKYHFTTINSCLCPVGSVDGASITTVEGIGNSKAGFHAVQGLLTAWCSIAFPSILSLRMNLLCMRCAQAHWWNASRR